MTTLRDLRRFAVSRSLFGPTTLERAIDTLGFVQADPIRAPARAQDLTLRPRVDGYRAGDLERRYASLDVEEDVFINYGFVTRRLAGPHASAQRGVAATHREEHACEGDSRVRPRARRGPPARRGHALRPRHGDQLLGRLVERHDAAARGDALQGPPARRSTRRAASASTRSAFTRRRRSAPLRGKTASTLSSISSSASTRRCRRPACRTS